MCGIVGIVAKSHVNQTLFVFLYYPLLATPYVVLIPF